MAWKKCLSDGKGVRITGVLPWLCSLWGMPPKAATTNFLFCLLSQTEEVYRSPYTLVFHILSAEKGHISTVVTNRGLCDKNSPFGEALTFSVAKSPFSDESMQLVSGVLKLSVPNSSSETTLLMLSQQLSFLEMACYNMLLPQYWIVPNNVPNKGSSEGMVFTY